MCWYMYLVMFSVHVEHVSKVHKLKEEFLIKFMARSNLLLLLDVSVLAHGVISLDIFP